MTLSDLAGNGTEGTFVPFQLFAGESDIITTNETVAAGVSVLKYTVMGKRADGYIVPWAPGTSDAAGATFATGSLTFGGQPTAADTVTINAVVITFVASGAVGAQVNIGGSATLTAQALKTYINANVATLGVNAAGAATILSLTAEAAGLAGNAITLAKSGTYPSVSAATMTGGADNAGEVAREAVAFCIMAQPAVLVWPASVTTETARRQAFDGSPISVKALK